MSDLHIAPEAMDQGPDHQVVCAEFTVAIRNGAPYATFTPVTGLERPMHGLTFDVDENGNVIDDTGVVIGIISKFSDADNQEPDTEIPGDEVSDGDYEEAETSSDKASDGDYEEAETSGDKVSDGDYEEPEASGDKVNDGDYEEPEASGGKVDDGDHQDPEVSGDHVGDGFVFSPSEDEIDAACIVLNTKAERKDLIKDAQKAGVRFNERSTKVTIKLAYVLKILGFTEETAKAFRLPYGHTLFSVMSDLLKFTSRKMSFKAFPPIEEDDVVIVRRQSTHFERTKGVLRRISREVAAERNGQPFVPRLTK